MKKFGRPSEAPVQPLAVVLFVLRLCVPLAVYWVRVGSQLLLNISSKMEGVDHGLVEYEYEIVLKHNAFDSFDATANATALPSRYCLVHVGKTAGSAVSCEVSNQARPELHCSKAYVYGSPSALRRAYAGKTHMWGGRRFCETSPGGFDSFVVTLRNPLERLVSWYRYEHPRNDYDVGQFESKCSRRLHRWERNGKGCFETLDAFAKSSTLPAQLRGNATLARRGKPWDCRELAFDVASGKQPCPGHNHFGYVYYENKMRTILDETGVADQVNSSAPLYDTTVYAIRSEQIARDWDGVEARFRASLSAAAGGVELFDDADFPATGAERFAFAGSGTVFANRTDDELSEEGRQNLCAALCEEIQAYKRFLYGARNLDAHDVLLSLNELRRSCPDEKYELHSCNREWNGSNEMHEGDKFYQEKEESESKEADATASFRVGDNVIANWKQEGKYYGGRVIDTFWGKKVTVRYYDDDSKETLDVKFVRHFDAAHRQGGRGHDRPSI